MSCVSWAASIETATIYHNERFPTPLSQASIAAPPATINGLQITPESRRIIFLTAGAAGMFCGSCMHDNALAKALIAQGHDCILQPVYTPLRTDEVSVARESVFFGGIQLYAIERFPWIRHLPAKLRRLLDAPALIRMVTRQDRATDPKVLGELAVSMLQGHEGHHAAEVERLTRWIVDDVQPDAIVLSNLLIGGSLPHIRAQLDRAGRSDVPIAVMLQGDDIFLDFLPEPFREKASTLCKSLVKYVDKFVTNSDFYSSKMGERFEIPLDKRAHLPLSIDTMPYQVLADGDLRSLESGELRSVDDFRIGYLARISPDKGLHHLVDAFIHLAKDGEHENASLHVAGYLGAQYKPYFDNQLKRLRDAGLGDRFTHHGELTLDQKVSYLRSLDLLCVPTDYHDPKGLFVLEALASGVPVLQPDHGAFGQLIRETGGGMVYESGNLEDLVCKIFELKVDDQARRLLAEQGRISVMKNHSTTQVAAQLIDILFADKQ
ncbi:glycosyltransferase family 4 protein [Rubripirellula amarantea]|nr:glycosyltransferase family 4 protein [Rubripirellula amarantea]